MFKGRSPSRFNRGARRQFQGGFSIVEVLVAITIMAILGIYNNAKFARDSEEVLAEGSGLHIKQVATAAERLTLLNFDNYANGLPITGVVDPLHPTVAELVALGRLNAGFPSGPGALPTRQSIRIDVLKTNCPGENCELVTLVCTASPVTLGAGNTRFDLVQTIVDMQDGSGGQSQIGFPNTIRGPTLNVANPMGSVEGIACGSSLLDTALYQRFVQRQDTRDPDLKGNLTVAGATTIGGATTINNNATVTGTLNAGGDTSVGTCAKIIASTGRAGFTCADPNDLPAGYAGGVRSTDVVAKGSLLATDNPAAFTGANGNYAYAGISGGVAEIRTSGRTAGDRLTPLGQYAAGSTCAAADEGSISRRAGATGLVVCQTGTWRAMATSAASGDVCAPEGTMATSASGVALLCVGGQYRGMDTIVRNGSPNQACTLPGTMAIDTANNNEALLCRLNPAGGTLRYMRVRDLVSNMSVVTSIEVSDVAYGASGVVAKPACTPASGQTGVPIIQLIPKGVSSADGGFSSYAVDVGGSWNVYLRNGAGGLLTGSPYATAIAYVSCYFP